ncbi:hypothetical protein T484DRAFT_1983975 [Baffinella frigidus]|nr:hypothetical protein T484DRAFT_1983975 [Cryptophyta sp. CCMP2293]
MEPRRTLRSSVTGWFDTLRPRSLTSPISSPRRMARPVMKESFTPANAPPEPLQGLGLGEMTESRIRLGKRMSLLEQELMVESARMEHLFEWQISSSAQARLDDIASAEKPMSAWGRRMSFSSKGAAERSRRASTEGLHDSPSPPIPFRHSASRRGTRSASLEGSQLRLVPTDALRRNSTEPRLEEAGPSQAAEARSGNFAPWDVLRLFPLPGQLTPVARDRLSPPSGSIGSPASASGKRRLGLVPKPESEVAP